MTQFIAEIAEPTRKSIQPYQTIPPRAPLATRAATLVIIATPFFGLIASAVFLWGWGLTWVELTLFGTMYVLTGLGITVGYHRFFTHRSFQTSTVVQGILGVLGSMACQGPLLHWVGVHRRHHQHSDGPDDPHSPHYHGQGIVGVLLGAWHAHLGWLFRPSPSDLARYVKDLRQSRFLRVLNHLFPVWVIAGLLLPTIVGMLLLGGWKGALLGLTWGGLVRIFFVHHVTWSVNSICPLWGRQPYPSHDESRNNFLVGVLALGEGWHNNHHAFPSSARHGLQWWQIDVSYWVIQALALLGLAWNVKVPARGALPA